MLDLELRELIAQWANDKAIVTLCFIHGSRVSGTNRAESDLDLACAFAQGDMWVQFDAMEELRSMLKMEVDLLDLRKAGGLILGEVLSMGICVKVSDPILLQRLWWDAQEFHEWINPFVAAGRQGFLKRYFQVD